ncbi:MULTISPECIES: sulfite exporter TauE/SafE family protein [Pseudomonas fluorescens group]|uniref:Probable membrane transporter protein n=2 Tax=Pseudomonas fluorescens group TaxID=136843 RepID=A0ABS9FES4_9PSED|nr:MULTISPECIES: sulfite exporter TauE/SafE family protein [Pseudomonas fluorescens group]MCF4991428.1 TSUP family transporter [Pseudomonas gessardii]MCF5097332.1 TSUP family transporter [Pseudomonas gessardii]MCF5110841.1 TSUP family transporter [Pseudomonas gessardii]RVD79567.1 putative permease [Pseudomonas koreensis]
MIVVLLLGLTVGVILALTGAGGGILAVPLLVFGVGLSMAEAGPIGLLAVGLAATLGAVMGLKNGTVRYKAALLIAGAGIVCSPLGLWLAQRTPNRPLTIMFAFVLMYVAFRVYQRSLPPSTESKPPVTSKPPPCLLDVNRGKLNWTRPCAWALAVSGVVAGGLSGLLGVGGGFVMVPALQRYTNLTAQSVLATSLAVIALVSISGVAASSAAGHLQWAVAIPFSTGALVGMLGGRLIAARLAGPHLQRGFAAVSIVVAVALLVKAV